MKRKKLQKIVAIAIVGAIVSTISPLKASAEWLNNSDNSWAWNENNSNATGWRQINGSWYHFDGYGKMQTGWVKAEDSNWYYLNSAGDMKTGWLKDSNEKWYHLTSSGAMKTGWLQDTDGKWYFMDQSGEMQTGIIEVQGKLYVLEANGAMKTGSIAIGGINYSIDESGAVIGDKLPIPEKSFTSKGVATNYNLDSNVNNITTENTNDTSSNNHHSSSHHSSSNNSGNDSGNNPGNDSGNDSGNNPGNDSGNDSDNNSGNGSDNNSGNDTDTDNDSNTNNDKDLSCDQAGIYGPETGTQTVENVSVNAKDVTLKNMHITGNLELGEGILDGDVTLENVTVDGTTIVRGGGEHSIHFVNSVLATVIVNKNDGKIRLVVEGSSQVAEVQLESPAKLEEDGLSDGATGFNDVNVTEDVQTGNNLQVELIGKFETINSRATQVKIQLAEGTDINNLILNAVANVLGSGTINTATINSGANGASLSSRPENMVLHANSVSLRDESGVETQITESYSNATSAQITGAKLSMDSIKLNMSNFVAGLETTDFNVTAKLDGEDITLKDVYYDSYSQRLNFKPLSLEENVGKILSVTITPASDKLTGTAQTDETTIKNGFSGRITDIQGVGIQGITLKFRAGTDSKDGDIVTTAVTDEYGYYTAYVEPGQYTGEISGSGVVKTYMYASSLSDIFNIEQNETAIRATGMDSIKIVLSWGEHPYDEDSHLEGPTADGQGRFHTWYSDKIYEKDGIRYADLDWDDTSSYGPETTTIYNLTNGKYRFYVHNYSGQNGGDSSLVESGAKVEVYKGNGVAPNNTFEISNDMTKANTIYWIVFDMDVSNNGQTIIVNEINQFRENMVLGKSETAEESYVFDERWGEITGVPEGTVADFKTDVLPYDGGILKILPQGTYIYDADEFDRATGLPDATVLENGQIVAIKEQDGIIKRYTIQLSGTDSENPMLSSNILTQSIPEGFESTTASAVKLTWNKATDDTTPQSDLKYSLYSSENTSYGNIYDWETDAELVVEDYDIDNYTVKNLNPFSEYFFKLIVSDRSGNKIGYLTEYRPASPELGDDGIFLTSNLLTQTTTSSGVKLTWEKAVDDTTPQSDLKYYLYVSEDEQYNNIDDWERNAKLLIEAEDIDEYTVTDLSSEVDYFFKLIVEDKDGNKKEYVTEY